MRVIVQLRSSPEAHRAATATRPAGALATGLASRVAGLDVDSAFPVVQVPGVRTPSGRAGPSLAQPGRFSFAPEESTYLFRGAIAEEGKPEDVLATARAAPGVAAVWADPVIETCPVCPGSPPVGNGRDVARLLQTPALARAGFDGKGVLLAIVDTGINLAHLRSKGRRPKLDAARSWTPAGVTTSPGAHAVNHGTMCAYDAGIAAPAAALLDHAVLLSRRQGQTAMEGLLSDAILSYAQLRATAQAMPRRRLVVSNSWGMFSPAWDLPPNDPGNYSDNPSHPFNVIVGSLEAAGADILFAAGNCGRDCPDGRCAFADQPPICGANSHPRVLTVAGVDVNKERAGYSSQGPGRLAERKPDVCGYTHFVGSGVYPQDGGTSAACPVVAGVVAAVRTKVHAGILAPAQLHALVRRHAEDRGGSGFDYDYGWGIIDTRPLLKAVRRIGSRTVARSRRPTRRRR